VNHHFNLSVLGVLVARWQVIDPPSWCGALTTTLFGDEETPLS
jgi:hypothetical protein